MARNDQPRRVYIIDRDITAGIALHNLLMNEIMGGRFDVVGVGTCSPKGVFGEPPIPETDDLIYDPRVDARNPSIAEAISNLRRVFAPSSVRIIVLSDDWAFQEFRSVYAKCGVRHGCVRNIPRLLLRQLESKIKPKKTS